MAHWHAEGHGQSGRTRASDVRSAATGRPERCPPGVSVRPPGGRHPLRGAGLSAAQHVLLERGDRDTRRSHLRRTDPLSRGSGESGFLERSSQQSHVHGCQRDPASGDRHAGGAPPQRAHPLEDGLSRHCPDPLDVSGRRGWRAMGVAVPSPVRALQRRGAAARRGPGHRALAGRPGLRDARDRARQPVARIPVRHADPAGWVWPRSRPSSTRPRRPTGRGRGSGFATSRCRTFAS